MCKHRRTQPLKHYITRLPDIAEVLVKQMPLVKKMKSRSCMFPIILTFSFCQMIVEIAKQVTIKVATGVGCLSKLKLIDQNFESLIRYFSNLPTCAQLKALIHFKIWRITIKWTLYHPNPTNSSRRINSYWTAQHSGRVSIKLIIAH